MLQVKTQHFARGSRTDGQIYALQWDTWLTSMAWINVFSPTMYEYVVRGPYYAYKEMDLRVCLASAMPCLSYPVQQLDTYGDGDAVSEWQHRTYTALISMSSELFRPTAEDGIGSPRYSEQERWCCLSAL